MNLNDIVLSPGIMADLYTNSLIDNSATAMPISTNPEYSGNFEKKILIVTANKKNPVIPSADLELLNGILKACSMQMNDVAVVNFYNPDAGTVSLQEQSKFILLFGIDPLTLGLPINFPYYQLQLFNKRTYLYAPSLYEVGNDRNIKANLWTSLKKMFGI
jgi:hypothetical protein